MMDDTTINTLPDSDEAVARHPESSSEQSDSGQVDSLQDLEAKLTNENKTKEEEHTSTEIKVGLEKLKHDIAATSDKQKQQSPTSPLPSAMTQEQYERIAAVSDSPASQQWRIEAFQRVNDAVMHSDNPVVKFFAAKDL